MPATPQEPTPPTQPPVIPQPSPSTQVTSGMKPATTERWNKQKKIALTLAIVSIVIFVVGLIVGYTLAVAAILGAYALMVGIRTKTVYLIVLGSIGLATNFLVYTLAIFANL